MVLLHSQVSASSRTPGVPLVLLARGTGASPVCVCAADLGVAWQGGVNEGRPGSEAGTGRRAHRKNLRRPCSGVFLDFCFLGGGLGTSEGNSPSLCTAAAPSTLGRGTLVE